LQVLEREERDGGEEEEEEEQLSGSRLVEEVASRSLNVFILSEGGKPIFASGGHEDALCPMFALLQVYYICMSYIIYCRPL
jgi:fructoselysine-6-P-deglycase FrlB-like protein